jgi:hypothetical protein
LKKGPNCQRKPLFLFYDFIKAAPKEAVPMAKRNSMREVVSPDQLSDLNELVVDKRNGKRAKAKKSRRNRHYEKQFLRDAVRSGLLVDQDQLS